MKKYLLILVLLLGATSLRAQFVGDLAVTRKVLSREGNTLHLVLDVQVSANAVTRSQSWTIIPELSTPDRQSMKLFPHILVNGRYQQHMMERRQVLNGRHLIERQPYVVIKSTARRLRSRSATRCASPTRPGWTTPRSSCGRY